MVFNGRTLLKWNEASKAAHDVWRENTNSSPLEFIPHLMRGRDKH